MKTGKPAHCQRCDETLGLTVVLLCANHAKQEDDFYAGWNAAIRTLSDVASTQGWWFPESALKLLVKA
jgi:hypothetical protein